jgi:hypothetical protein
MLNGLLTYRKKSRGRGRIDAFISGCLSNIAQLWHCRLGSDFWEAACPLESSILCGPFRTRRVPGMFKHALVRAAAAQRGKGVRRPGQLLVGVQLLKKRKGLPVLEDNKAGLDSERFNCWNYWLSMRIAFLIEGSGDITDRVLSTIGTHCLSLSCRCRSLTIVSGGNALEISSI